MKDETSDTLLIHAAVEVPAQVLTTVVETAKKKAGPSPKGGYRIDTAAVLNGLITRFLAEKDFLGFVRDLENHE